MCKCFETWSQKVNICHPDLIYIWIFVLTDERYDDDWTG